MPQDDHLTFQSCSWMATRHVAKVPTRCTTLCDRATFMNEHRQEEEVVWRERQKGEWRDEREAERNGCGVEVMEGEKRLSVCGRKGNRFMVDARCDRRRT